MKDWCGVQGACALGAKLASGCLCWLGVLTAQWLARRVWVARKVKNGQKEEVVAGHDDGKPGR